MNKKLMFLDILGITWDNPRINKIPGPKIPGYLFWKNPRIFRTEKSRDCNFQKILGYPHP